MIRVLLADDSPTARELLKHVLEDEGTFEVVAEAGNGKQAIELTARLRPDVIVMDLVMPIIDGMEATSTIMAETPTPIVITTATQSLHEASTAMMALEAGALSLIEKPNLTKNGQALINIIQAFTRTIRLMSAVKVVRHARKAVTVPKADFQPHTMSITASRKIQDLQAKPATCITDEKRRSIMAAHYRRNRQKPAVIAIATSTGGPPAVAQILQNLDADYPLPICIVQHIGSGFIHGMANWLNRSTPLQVLVAQHGDKLLPGHVYLAPDDSHFGVTNGQVILSQTPAIGGFRPSANFLFDSIASSYGPSAAALVLTGMGEDGVKALTVLNQSGALVVAQDEASSTIFGMPCAAIASGNVDLILSINEIVTFMQEIIAL